MSAIDSAALAALEHRFASAVLERNAALLDSLMADEWTITLTDGRRSDKRRAMARWTAPPAPELIRSESLVDSVVVRSLGADAAVVTAAYTDIDVKRTSADTTRSRVTDIVERRNGRWQFVLSHESIRPTPARTP